MRPSDALTHFSQIHLTTAAERAVYECFATAPFALRSARDVARSGRLPIRDAEEALARFADAGIVREAHGLYRWHEELRYVFEQGEPDGALRDPVCGMPVTSGSSLRTHDVFGRVEYFCSNRCLDSFVVWPIAFTRPRGASRAGGEESG